MVWHWLAWAGVVFAAIVLLLLGFCWFVEDEMDGVDRRIVARARDRSVKLTLQPLTRTVTRALLSVSSGHFGKDRATASEIVVQIENTVDTRGYAFVRTSFSGRRVPD